MAKETYELDNGKIIKVTIQKGDKIDKEQEIAILQEQIEEAQEKINKINSL